MMTLNIIWFAMLASLVVYLAVGLLAGENLNASMAPDVFNILKYNP